MATQNMDMFKTQIHRPHLVRTFFLLNIPCIPSHSCASFFIRPGPQLQKKYRNVRVGYVPNNTKAVASGTNMSIYVKATVTVKLTIGGFLCSLVGLRHGLDDIPYLFRKSLLLELVSAELDPNTGLEKKPISGYAHRTGQKDGEVIYESEFVIPGDFGEIGAVLVKNEQQNEMYLKRIVLNGVPNGPIEFNCGSWVEPKFDKPEKRVFFTNKIGAVLVENEHQNEMYLKYIVLNALPNGPIEFNCGSWVEPKFDKPEKRVFFTNKSYLPSQTPRGLKSLREKDLISLRGNGKGDRKSSDRIYDYDLYNDLGDPDSKPELKRPVLGGSKKYPYPRRCRTGRPRSKIDPHSETRSGIFYVPRDEEFSEEKEKSFIIKTADSVLEALLPSLAAYLVDPDTGFRYFSDIDQLYNQGITIPKLKNQGSLQSLLLRLVKAVSDAKDDVLQFKTPAMFQKDKFSWLRDEEFSRQTLAGVNPYSIKLVREWPLKSALDPDVYGPPESAITTELVERETKDFMTVDEALKQKKLFIIDYHDLLLPYVSKVRQIKGTSLYGSRALFFLTPDGTLKPLAIELTRPPMDGKPQWKQVFTPSLEATGLWLWRFAKAHFLAHDSGYHELVSHWLRTHCATEPYIIATNRQLSVMHPIYRLLHPHCRYTMKINAFARQALINADGIIETSFSPRKYSMELSSVAYDQQWRFDREALPADLINRGIAIEDPTAPHGLKLLIEDYPFANDGLVLWDALKQWVADYVNYYYKDASMVQSDPELQAWWTEIRTKGHEDKKDEPWWPVLQTPKDLIGIITTIVWVASAHHSAVNFGQYAFAGYFPNRPTIARTNMPCEDPTKEGWNRFLDNPDSELLVCFPSKIQAAKVMAIFDLLSNHSRDEEYLGEHMEPTWGAEPAIKEAFERFSARLKELEHIINARNKDKSLKNRGGAGVVPYELLKPFSGEGLTGKGVPYSISI